MQAAQNKLAGYKKLIAYQKAKELVMHIYKATSNFPSEEKFVLIPQMRRAAVSIPSNIAEGYIKSSSKELMRFLDISIGSAAELEVQIDIAYKLGYLKNVDFDTMNDLLIEIKKLIYSYKKGLKKQKKTNL